MAIPGNIRDLEHGKFVESPEGEVSVRVRHSKEENPFGPPLEADAVTVNYPSSTVEEYQYRTGGTLGTILKTVTVTYNSGSKNEILTVVVS